MIDIRAVVAATDLSAPARRAVERGARLAAAARASLTLVHVVDAPLLDDLRRRIDTGGDAGRSILDDLRARLHGLGSEVASRYRLDVDERTVTGRAVDEIARVAEELEAEVIVTGTLGASAFRSQIIGSTAERVVRKSLRPVLMVRQSVHEAYRRVLIAIDFSRWSAPSLAIAAAVAPDAHFVLLHAVEVPFEGRLRLAGVAEHAIDKLRTDARDEASRRLAELATRSGLPADRWTTVIVSGHRAWMQIVREEQEHDCDLVVVGKHGRSAVEELLLGSTTNMVIAEGSADVLVSTHADPS